MFIAVVYLLSTLLSPAPITSMTVIPASNGSEVVIHFLNSDTRYEDFLITVDDQTFPLHAPLSDLQTITVTLNLSLDLTCSDPRPYQFIVSAQLMTDTIPFARTEVGGMAILTCPYRSYVPLLNSAAID